MNENLINLAKRAVDTDGFFWVDGMAGAYPSDTGGWIGIRIESVGEDGTPAILIEDSDILHDCDGWWDDCPAACGTFGCSMPTNGDVVIPDFSDPLTCQAVPLMVRAKHGPECYSTRPINPGRPWTIIIPRKGRQSDFHEGYTELAAWVAALEAER